MYIRNAVILSALCAGLAACGDTIGEQAVGGAAVGAGVAAITDGSLARGAALGAAGNVLYCELNPGQCN